MYCGHCGAQLKKSFQFCVNCGNPAPQSFNTLSASVSERGTASSTERISSSQSVPTFASFIEKKKDDRVSRFKKTKKRTSTSEEQPVTINVEIMRYVDEESLLKPTRGKSLPLKLRKTADCEEILKLAMGKHSMHNTNEILNTTPGHYKLLYPDGTEVKKLKETDEPFTLQGYKVELGKPYNRITFYLCSTSNSLSYRMKGIANSLLTDDDMEDENEIDPERTQSRIKNSSGTGACEPKRFCPDTVMASCTITKPSIMSSNQPLGSAPGFQKPNSELCKSVTDIFPALPDWKILNALQNTEDLEAAVTKLCDDRTGGSCDQFHSYASVIEENEAEL